MPRDLDEWIDRIRNQDPMTYEDAYWGERPTDFGVVPRLVVELHRSPDGYTRCKLLELLGEMGDASAVPALISELSHLDSNVRAWAVLALEELGLPDSVEAAKRHRELNAKDFT